MLTFKLDSAINVRHVGSFAQQNGRELEWAAWLCNAL